MEEIDPMKLPDDSAPEDKLIKLSRNVLRIGPFEIDFGQLGPLPPESPEEEEYSLDTDEDISPQQ
jgi:hypothetical protein